MIQINETRIKHSVRYENGKTINTGLRQPYKLKKRIQRNPYTYYHNTS